MRHRHRLILLLQAGLICGPLFLQADAHPPSSPGVAGTQFQTSYFAQIAVGHAGRLRFDTDFLFINSGNETEFALDFFDSTGEPLTVLLFRESAPGVSLSSMRTPLTRGQTLNLSIRLEGTARTGYARVTTGEGVSGVVAFTRTDVEASKIEYQTGGSWSLHSTDFTIPVKFVPGVGDMAYAIVNPASDSSQASEVARITFRLYDEAFQLHGTAEATLPAGAHQARFIGELFPQLEELAAGVGFNGSMTVESDRPLAVMSVLHTAVPTLTVVPVTPGRAERPPEQK